MTVDRNALADDMEALGLKALSAQVRNGRLPVDRALKAVERTRDRARNTNGKLLSDCQAVLNRYDEGREG